MNKLSRPVTLASAPHGRLIQPTLLLKLAGSLGSGLISALSLTAIASQRIGQIDGDSAVTLLLVIQWQVMALTVAKLGIDQAIFSVVSRDPSIRFALGDFLWRKSLPIAVFGGVVISMAFSPMIGLIAACSVVVDTYSVMVTADLNARERFGATAVANLLNYPVFFLLLLVATGGSQDVAVFVLLFLVSSVARAAWLASRCRYGHEQAGNVVHFRGAPTLATQQALNYMLFRGDQLLLALMPVAGIGLASSLHRDEYVYLGKFPELVAGGLVTMGLYLFPRIRLQPEFLSVRTSVRLPDWLWLVLGGLTAGLIVVFGLYTSTWLAPAVMGDGGRWPAMLPFLLQALLILPVNGLTYVFLAQGHASALVRFQAVALVSAAALAAMAFQQRSLEMLAWVVPMQLAVFLLVGIYSSVRSSARRPLYV